MTARTNAGDNRRRRLSTRCGGHDHSCATKRLQSLPNVRCRAIDIVVSAQFLREFGPLGTTSDCRDLETHVSGILQGKMTEPAYSQDGDEVSGLRRRITQGTEGRDAGAKERRRLNRMKLIRDGNKTAGLGDHDFGIAAIGMDAGVSLILTIY
jgi:hypothetical protein